MPTFPIEITETLQRTIPVEADTIEEAMARAEGFYLSEAFELDYQHLIGTEFSDPSAPSRTDEYKKLVSILVDYLYDIEKKHFEECEEAEKHGHIFLVLERLRREY